MTKLEQTADEMATGDPTRPITPIDVRQSSFPSAWRGYAPAAVRSFLLETSEHFERALRDNDKLRQEVVRLEGAIRQHRELEATLQTTLLHAQKVSDDLRANAQLESERILREAKGRAELMIAAAENRLEDAQREIDGLRLRRREAECTVESIITSLQGTLEFIREQSREPKLAGPQRLAS
jgi:cell division initiation protein